MKRVDDWRRQWSSARREWRTAVDAIGLFWFFTRLTIRAMLGRPAYWSELPKAKP